MEAFISQLDGIDQGQTLRSYRPHLLAPIETGTATDLKQCFNVYFSTWHPLFPFLDGVYLRNIFDTWYESVRQGNNLYQTMLDGVREEEALVLTAVFRAIFTIGGKIRSTNTPGFENASDATALAHVVVDACDSLRIDHVSAIQAIFAIALSLFFTRRLRQASHLVGIVLSKLPLQPLLTSELSLEAGLHRCPCRYPTTFDISTDRDLRKRLFYSIYVLDRLLSRQLGLPLLLRDVDIDVCLPGAAEIHGTEACEAGGLGKRKRDDDAQSPIPVHPSNPNEPPDGSSVVLTPSSAFLDARSKASGSTNRLLVAFSLAQLAGIMGRMMETFNGSRRWRIADGRAAVLVITDSSRECHTDSCRSGRMVVRL